jgi:DNA helicase-2/ATP-dependent DNA helicase PcrA
VTSGTRSSIDKINRVLSFLADPLSSQKLADVYKISRPEDREDNFQLYINQTEDIIRKANHVEDYLWPKEGRDWLEEIKNDVYDPNIIEELIGFRRLIQRWQGTIILPVEQIILTFSQDLFNASSDLAIAQKIAVLLRQTRDDHPEWRLSDLTQELELIVNNQRRFLGFSEEDFGFDPEKYKGIVVVSTLHKAKGLEWDRVYLLSVNNYDFPGNSDEDPFIAEKWFVRDHLNIQAESIAQLDTLISTGENVSYEEGLATLNSRLDYIRERLRLLYVGITRAKKELIITWNTGRQNNRIPAIALQSLYDYWSKQEIKKNINL